MDTRASKTSKYSKNQRETATGALGGVKHTGKKVTEGTTLHCIPTYKVVSSVRFTNVLLAMLVMALLYKYLRMKADYQVNEKMCISAVERNCEGEEGVTSASHRVMGADTGVQQARQARLVKTTDGMPAKHREGSNKPVIR